MRRGNHSKSRASKGLVLLLALVLVFGVAVGGTIAWLTAKTPTITNTFTTSGVDITLEETADDNNNGEFKMIPGHTITKDPVVTVLANSEKCYLFVKVDAVGNVTGKNGTTYAFNQYLSYEMAVDEENEDIWTPLGSEAGVYYRVVETNTENQPFPILKGDKVTVSVDVTNEMMDAIDTDAERPTLSFTAYACQYYNGISETGTATNFEPADAWTHAQTAAEPNP